MHDLLFAYVSCHSNAKIIEVGEDLMELQCAIDWHVFLWITVYKYAHWYQVLITIGDYSAWCVCACARVHACVCKDLVDIALCNADLLV